MAKDNKNLSKKPKFNSWWIYGIVIVVFLGIQMISGMSGSGAKKINTSEFFDYMRQGDVSEILIVNEKVARIYLTKDAQDKEIHKASKPTSILPQVDPMPNYTFEFGDLQFFQEKNR
jgi:cell division protease FtsH